VRERFAMTFRRAERRMRFLPSGSVTDTARLAHRHGMWTGPRPPLITAEHSVTVEWSLQQSHRRRALRHMPGSTMTS
jgi:hypothetical protein